MREKTSDYKSVTLSGSLKEDTLLFKKLFSKDSTFRAKTISVKNSRKFNCNIIYLDGMVDSEQLNDAVIRPLLTVDNNDTQTPLLDYVESQVLFARDVKRADNLEQVLNAILYGEALILLDGSKTALTTDVKGWKTRGIKEPDDERILQGPREGFEEAAMLNLAMLRRKLQTPDLCFEMLKIGKISGTMVFVCYLNSLASPQIVAEVKRRLGEIDIDGVLDSNYLTEHIRSGRYSLFKTTGATERPDVVAARLLEGRVALVVDGTPVVVTLPYLFCENFQSDEDYYLSFLVSSAGRLLRYICFFLSTSIPAIFIALTSFHRELLPTSMAIAISQLRGGVPFSPFTECLIMIFVFEILKETGVRMPQSLGHALSIVGGLVVGQAAVEARIISTPMLIAIAISGISGLMIPKLKGAVFYLRLFYVIVAALFGLYGYLAAISITVMHIISLTSFGVDYTISLRKADFQSLKDTLWRAPWPFMKTRPSFNRNLIRSRLYHEK